MKMLISGGCKMGKSTIAQQLAVSYARQAYYIATMHPRDAEDRERIARHRQDRSGMGFITVECPRNAGLLMEMVPHNASLLLDSTTALLAEEMFGSHGDMDSTAPSRTLRDLLRLADTFECILFVSDTIHSDANRFDASTEAYREGLAAIDCALAQRCDVCIEMVYGLVIVHKGEEKLDSWLNTHRQGLWHGTGTVYGTAGVRALGRSSP